MPVPLPFPRVYDQPYARLCFNAKWASWISGLIDPLGYRDWWTHVGVLLESHIDTYMDDAASLFEALGDRYDDCVDCNQSPIPGGSQLFNLSDFSSLTNWTVVHGTVCDDGLHTNMLCAEEYDEGDRCKKRVILERTNFPSDLYVKTVIASFWVNAPAAQELLKNMSARIELFGCGDNVTHVGQAQIDHPVALGNYNLVLTALPIDTCGSGVLEGGFAFPITRLRVELNFDNDLVFGACSGQDIWFTDAVVGLYNLFLSYNSEGTII